MLAARRASPALATGAVALLPAPAGVLAYERAASSDRRVVLVNFADEPVAVDVGGDWHVEVDSDGLLEGEGFPGRLAGNHAVVLRSVD